MKPIPVLQPIAQRPVALTAPEFDHTIEATDYPALLLAENKRLRELLQQSLNPSEHPNLCGDILKAPERRCKVKLAFVLSMPGNNSWNGKWSGAGSFYAIVKDFGRTQKANDKAASILSRG